MYLPSSCLGTVEREAELVAATVDLEVEAFGDFCAVFEVTLAVACNCGAFSSSWISLNVGFDGCENEVLWTEVVASGFSAFVVAIGSVVLTFCFDIVSINAEEVATAFEVGFRSLV